MDGASDRDGALEGGAFYDDDAVFETYRAHRLSARSPNELVEEPAFLEMFGHNLHGTPGVVLQANIETIDLEPRSFDLVLSRLALHYVDDLAGVLKRVQQALVNGGRLAFSVEHPVITSCDRGCIDA